MAGLLLSKICFSVLMLSQLLVMVLGSSDGITSLGPWGGLGGEPWTFEASKGITEIIIGTAPDTIVSLSFRDADGRTFGPFGSLEPGQKQTVQININWPSESLISIFGSYGKSPYYDIIGINSLSFNTNLKQSGPLGHIFESDTPFFALLDGNVIIGFHGRNGSQIDALGVFMKPV